MRLDSSHFSARRTRVFVEYVWCIVNPIKPTAPIHFLCLGAPRVLIIRGPRRVEDVYFLYVFKGFVLFTQLCIEGAVSLILDLAYIYMYIYIYISEHRKRVLVTKRPIIATKRDAILQIL